MWTNNAIWLEVSLLRHVDVRLLFLGGDKKKNWYKERGADREVWGRQHMKLCWHLVHSDIWWPTWIGWKKQRDNGPLLDHAAKQPGFEFFSVNKNVSLPVLKKSFQPFARVRSTPVLRILEIRTCIGTVESFQYINGSHLGSLFMDVKGGSKC